ncbi:hydrogenase [Methylacidiphilum kamchatkense Kam1]|uniref:Hydrogenase n=1 Tax=Methylacidiphilum kamchatkense Kam1 TaxID=1202785 RepID=A0A0C1RKR9_9BACT|nr:hydrogenase expression/formation C-terminal domain-containing protein [Methylacidiphilum kamchatkense]KIE58637.1 hydrogenase [Methylacidiphilum kamchatkense Kam1]QDQ41981.1 HupH hydrogenase expression protein [Methylacidiphilum kamchatkense Kam1]
MKKKLDKYKKFFDLLSQLKSMFCPGYLKGNLRSFNLISDIIKALYAVLIESKKNIVYDLSVVVQNEIEEFFRILGLGELCIFYSNAGAVFAAQQTLFSGVWWVENKIISDKVSNLSIEIGLIPRFVSAEREERLQNLDFDTMLPSLKSTSVGFQALISSLVRDTKGNHLAMNEKKIQLNLLPLVPQDKKTLFSLLPKTAITIYSQQKQAWVFGTPWKNIWWIEELTDVAINRRELGLLVCEFPYSLFPVSSELRISARRLEKIAAQLKP